MNHPSLQSWLEKLLYLMDPMHLRSLGCPEDEYSPEADAILQELPDITSSSELTCAMEDIFTRYFEPMPVDINLSSLGYLVWNYYKDTYGSMDSSTT